MELITRTTRTMPKGQSVTRIPRKGDLAPTYPKGRVCSERGCDTILNHFHKGPRCFACELASMPAEEREAA